MPATIVVAQSIGQIGNRLEQFSHLIAFARDHGAKVINPAFSLYSEFFEGTHDDLLCRYPAQHASWVTKKLQRIAYYILRTSAAAQLFNFVPNSIWIDIHWSGASYDLSNPQFIEFVRKYKWIFLTGHWKDRYPGEAYYGQIEAIRQHFTLIPPIRERVEAFLNKTRTGKNILVGVHIRQGDNFTDPVRRDRICSEEYPGVMRNFNALLPDKDITFVICTNKPQPKELFEGLNIVDAPGEFIEDLYVLAGCDYIFGAGQSSFSMWASLIGGVPRYALFDASRAITLEDFEVFVGRGLK